MPPTKPSMLAQAPDSQLDTFGTDKKSALASRLRTGILSGEVLPGERLKEKTLSEEFGCSRSTVREVFSLLTSEGLLTKQPNAGVEVSLLSREEILSAMDVRFALDMVAVSSILEDPTGARTAQVEAAYNRYKLGIQQGQLADHIRAHLSFHEDIWKASGNESLLQYWPLTASRMSLYVAQESQTRGDTERDLSTHRRLVDALRSRNHNLVRQEFYAHTVLAARKMLDAQ